MADEAVVIELLGNRGNPLRFTVPNGTAVSAGTLMVLVDPRTAIKSTYQATAPDQRFAGIAAADKEANDGATTLALYTTGIFDITATTGGAAISAGDLVVLSGANLVVAAPDQTTILSGRVVGKAMEDVAANTAEVIVVAVGLYQ